MKRQYSHRRNAYGGALWGFGAVFAMLMLLALIRFLLPGVFVALASPLWSSGTSLDAGVGSVFVGFADKATLAKENAALSQEVAILQSQNAVLTARSQDLTTLLGGQTSGATELLAGVLVRPPVAAYDTLVVSQGSSDGVAVGAETFTKGGIPIGTVKSVTAHTAIIELFSTGGRVTNGWVGSARTPLTLTGGGGGTFSAILPKGAAITVGDSAYIAGPGALPFGTIVRVDANPSSPTVVLHIQPAVNIFSITWVQIASS